MRKELWLAWLGLFVFGLGWFWREAFFNQLFCFSDLTFYFYPYRQFMVESLRHWQIPLWNPYINAGFPFLATLQPGIFYPLSVIYFLMPFNLAFNWFLIIHYPLAAFFMYLLCREYKFTVTAAAVGGLTFGFSGYLISVLHMPTTLAAMIWLPLIILVFDKGITEITGRSRGGQGFWSWLALTLLLVVMFLGGEPTVLYGTGWLLLAYLLAKTSNWQQRLHSLGWLLAAFLVAGLLSAIQLFPFLELVSQSVRSGGISFREASFFSLPPRALVEFAIPYFFHLSEFPWVDLGWAKTPYLGIVPICLAALAFWQNKERRLNWVLLAAIFVVWVVLGHYTPLYWLLFKFVPGFASFRYPVKFTFILVFILAYLAARGTDKLIKEPQSFRPLLKGAGWGLLVWLFCYLVLVTNRELSWQLLRPFFITEIVQGLEPYVFSMVFPRNLANLGIFTLLLLAVWALIWGRVLGKIRPTLFADGLVILVAFDLYSANAGANLTIAAEKYGVIPPNLQLLLEDKEKFRYFVSPVIYRRSHLELRTEFLDYAKTIFYMRNSLTANQGMIYRLSDVDGYESISTRLHNTFMQKIWSLNSLQGVRVFDILNVKYLLSNAPLPNRNLRLLRTDSEPYKIGQTYLYENKSCLQRYLFVPKAKVIANESVALDYVFSPRFNPKEEVILDRQPDKKSAWLFCSEVYYPGWRAFVNGREVPIYRANYLFRAVPVNDKAVDIRFIYDPISFKLGAIVTLLTIVGLAIAVKRR